MKLREKLEISMRVTRGSKNGKFESLRQKLAHCETTKLSKKVEEMLYSKFKGNEATWYGTLMESTSRHDHQRYQSQQGHKLTTVRTGLMISSENPWLVTSQPTWWREFSPMGPGRVQEPIQCETLKKWRRYIQSKKRPQLLLSDSMSSILLWQAVMWFCSQNRERNTRWKEYGMVEHLASKTLTFLFPSTPARASMSMIPQGWCLWLKLHACKVSSCLQSTLFVFLWTYLLYSLTSSQGLKIRVWSFSSNPYD